MTVSGSYEEHSLDCRSGGKGWRVLAVPVMNVTRNPYRRRIQPDIVAGQMKYAPK
jgi:hypothetical protein